MLRIGTYAMMMRSGTVDVVGEATGNPVAGIYHAQMAISHGLHIVMVNVEADVLAGAELARRARSAGTCLLYTSDAAAEG